MGEFTLISDHHFPIQRLTRNLRRFSIAPSCIRVLRGALGAALEGMLVGQDQGFVISAAAWPVEMLGEKPCTRRCPPPGLHG